jgi:CPA2 family monovalent cation:H+ antiporter-2
VLLGVRAEDRGPVLRVGGCAVLLAQDRSRRQLEQPRRHQAQSGAGERGLAALERAPGAGPGLRPALVQPPPQPLGQGQRAGPSTQQLVAQLGEAAAVSGQQGVLVGRRARDVHEVAHERHLAAHDGVGQHHLDVGVREELVVHGAGPVAELPCGRRRQPDDDGLVAQRRGERGDEQAPGLEQVRALVDDQRPRAERRRALDELASPRVEQRQQVRALDPPDRRPAALGERAVGAVLDVLVVGAAVPGAERLVGQDGHRRAQVGRRARRDGVGPVAAEGVPRAQPLRAHDGARHEHQRPARQAARGLEAHERLARAGREDDAGAPAVEPVQGVRLRGAQGDRRTAPVPGAAGRQAGVADRQHRQRRRAAVRHGLVQRDVVGHRDILPDRCADRPGSERALARLEGATDAVDARRRRATGGARMLLAAGEGPPAFLTQIAALVVAGAVIGYACARLRVVPIVGFLLAGVLIGPNALGVVREREIIDAAAEVGVILLLFTIGIEFSIGRLMAIRRLVLLGGSLQVASAVAVTTGLLVLAGVELRAAVFTGLLVSLSSTAIVLKLLGDRGATASPTGQTSLGLLVFQDLAVVAMVLVLPCSAGRGTAAPAGWCGPCSRPPRSSSSRSWSPVASCRPCWRRSPGPAPRGLPAVGHRAVPRDGVPDGAGRGLGVARGVPGRAGRERVRHSAHALGEVLPLQILFSATFFLSIGTLLDVRFLLQEPLLVLAAVVLVLVVKAVTTSLAAFATGVGAATAVSAGLLLAQVGEFAFVLERLGREQGLSPAGLGEDGSQAFIAATVLLLVATPGLAAGGRAVAARLGRRTPVAVQSRAVAGDEPAAGHVVLSGWGSAARHLADELTGSGVEVVVMTLSPDGAAEAEHAGLRVVRGDSTKAPVLEAAGAAEARAVVVGDDEPEQAARIAAVLATAAPRAQVVVLSPSTEAVGELHAAGVHDVVVADRTAHERLAQTVLARLRPPPPPAATVVDTARVVAFRASAETACVHAPVSRPVLPSAPGCTECLREGSSWVHLRLCTSCGHVGCCDSSPGRHAAAHADRADHPVMCSAEPGEDWGWCYLDRTTLEPASSASASA